MNKFGLFLCFILAIGYAQSSIIDGIDMNDFYEKFIQISKGMSDSNSYKCASTLARHKTKVLEMVEKVVKDVKGGKSLTDALISNAIGLVFLDGFSTDCNVSSIISIAPELLKVKGIQTVGSNLVKNASDIENYIDEFMKAENLDGKLLAIGKIIRAATGITFH